MQDRSLSLIGTSTSNKKNELYVLKKYKLLKYFLAITDDAFN
jgi:hypothetical protein